MPSMKFSLIITAFLFYWPMLPASIQARVQKNKNLEIHYDKHEQNLVLSVTALENNLEALQDSVQNLQTSMDSLLKIMTTMQFTTSQIESCLSETCVNERICTPDVKLVEECMCSSDVCEIDHICVKGTTCIPECTNDMKINNECICSGDVCQYGHTCVNGKTCIPECINDMRVLEECMCSGEVCESNHKHICVNGKTCISECINDVKLEKECVCSGDICEPNHICVNGRTCIPECINDVKLEKECVCSGDVCESNHVCANGTTCIPECINDVKLEKGCVCSGDVCESNHICFNGTTCRAFFRSFLDKKCFQEDSDLTFHDIGKNQYGQITLPNWKITEGGRTLIQLKNTRPSIGVSDVGDPLKPVSYNGRIFSENSDSDVIGIVFGYQDKKNFFIVASSSTNSPGPFNWYVGRVHATCGRSCHKTKTISKAIWNPSARPKDITVLKSGTDFWLSENKYKFSICFNPYKLLMNVTIINESNGNVAVLETGTMSGAIGNTDLDDMSRGGGAIGVYVDSQQGTTWERLECSTCNL